MSKHRKISRRTWLKGIAVFSVLMLASTAAEAKASKASVHYRDYPNTFSLNEPCNGSSPD